MSAFLSPLWLEDLDGTRWIVCAPFRYCSTLLRGVVVVPAGTRTNLASIPWLLRGLLPRSGKWNKAAVLHDAGYHHELMTETGLHIHLIKPLCDELFLEAMLAAGVNGWLARRMYRVVAAFGRTRKAQAQ